MFGARYQWILVGGALGGWRPGGRASGCSADNLVTAADGSIRLRIGQLRGTQVLEDQDAAVRQLIQDQSELSRRRAFAYDAVWVAAKAVSQVMETVKRREKKNGWSNSSLGQEEVHRELLEALQHTHFEGLTVSTCTTPGTHTWNTHLINITPGTHTWNTHLINTTPGPHL